MTRPTPRLVARQELNNIDPSIPTKSDGGGGSCYLWCALTTIRSTPAPVTMPVRQLKIPLRLLSIHPDGIVPFVAGDAAKIKKREFELTKAANERSRQARARK